MVRAGLTSGLALALLIITAPGAAMASEETQSRPPLSEIIPLRERAAVIDTVLELRLDTLIPQIMREEGVDMWLHMSREYFEDPVTASMLNATSMHARRRTILIFFDPGGAKPVERLTVSRYGLAGLFEPAWDPARQPDQWQAVADIIAARDPGKIAINVSAKTRFGDGMTKSQHDAMMAALAPTYRARIVSGETLSTRWLEARISPEMDIYSGLGKLPHQLIAQAFSRQVITPGITTCADVQWWLRERIQRLGLKAWFHPSCAIQRQGVKGMIDGDTVIEPGDLLWTDIGLTYLRLNTDTQHLAYVLHPVGIGQPRLQPGWHFVLTGL
ncbi:MAG: hypothetical protein AAFQ90_11450 [Pseudomonadota bacterium]